MDPALATVIAAALGGTSVLGYAVQGIVKWRTGRAAEERRENKSIVDRADRAERLADWESAARRLMQELAGRERHKLLEAGLPIEKWPVLEEELGPRP